MGQTYDQYTMSKDQRKLMFAWNKMHPISEWECERDSRVEAIQGNKNLLLSKCDKLTKGSQVTTNQNLLSVEATILARANSLISLLKDLKVNMDEETELTDIQHIFSELTGLTLLVEVDNHGLSETLVANLKKIDKEAMSLLADLSNLKRH